MAPKEGGVADLELPATPASAGTMCVCPRAASPGVMSLPPGLLEVAPLEVGMAAGGLEAIMGQAHPHGW